MSDAKNLGNAATNARTANTLDFHIGKRLRLRRALLDIRQDELAGRIGVTFQQLQKYETGENRISASRLYQLARELDTTINWFFGDLPTRDPQTGDSCAEDLHALVSQNGGGKLLREFQKIEDPAIRRHIIEIVRVIASGKANGST